MNSFLKPNTELKPFESDSTRAYIIVYVLHLKLKAKTIVSKS